jgi:hypothetical protein
MRILPIFGLVAAFLIVKLAGNPDLLAKHTVVGNQLAGQNGGGGLFNLTTIMGEVIVFFFYWYKFNEWAGTGAAPKGFRPRPARHFTTWLRFLGWNSFYGLLMVGVYTVIIFFPELIFRLLDSFVTASNTFKTNIPGIASAHKLFGLIPISAEMKVYDPERTAALVPYAVMLTTVIWAGMRPFSEFERRFRLRLQERAAIPTEARNLIGTFENEMCSFEPADKNIKRILEEQEGQIFEKDDFRDSGRHLWFFMARVQYLYHLLVKYNREPVFARLAERYDDEFNDIHAKIAKIHTLTAKRISDINDLAYDVQLAQQTAEKDGREVTPRKRTQLVTLKTAEQYLDDQLESATKYKKDYFEKQEKELRDAVKQASADVVQVIVCSVLAVGRSRQHCRDLLEAFGLKQQNPIPNQLDTVAVTWVAGAALSISFFCSLVYYFVLMPYVEGDPELTPSGVNGIFYWAVVTTSMHLLATIGGYFCQRNLESGRARLQVGDLKAKPPSAQAQIAEAMWSASFGFALNVFLLGTLMALDGKFQNLVAMWWWALVPSVTAFFAALYTQRSEHTKQHLRWLMRVQGETTGLASLLVFYLLYSQNLKGLWGFGLYATATSIILGVALGKILQAWVEGIELKADKAGEPDLRGEKRLRPLINFAKWHTEDGEKFPARVLNITSTGAELATKRPLEIESEGVVKIIGREERRAKVVRNNRRDDLRIYVEFLGSAAPS